MFKVMVVDDHALVRAALKMMLNQIPGVSVIAEAQNGEEAIEVTKNLLPDLILMDIHMPGIGGFEATRHLLQLYPEIKILIISVSNSPFYPLRFFAAGAYGYIPKNASPEELREAIETIRKGEHYVHPWMYEIIGSIKWESEEITSFCNLSLRELQIFLMCAQGMSTQQVARQLLLKLKTVNAHRQKIFRKLKMETGVQLTLFAIKQHLIEA